MSRMPRQWTIHRQITPAPDGWRRWDQVYQLLLQGAPSTAEPSLLLPALDQEKMHESGLVRPRLHPATSQHPNH
jgi:hypothetical protein